MVTTGNFIKWLNTNFEGRVWFMEPMSKHTYFKIGGPADVLVIPETNDEVIRLVAEAIRNNVPWMVIGGGSNLIVKDSGIKGLVIKTMHQKGWTSLENCSGDFSTLLAAVFKGSPSLLMHGFND